MIHNQIGFPHSLLFIFIEHKGLTSASPVFASSPRVSPWLVQALAQSTAESKNQVPSLSNVLGPSTSAGAPPIHITNASSIIQNTPLTEKQLMPPPTFSPKRNIPNTSSKNNSPARELSPAGAKSTPNNNGKVATPNKSQALNTHTEKVFERIRQFIVAVQSKSEFFFFTLNLIV